MHVIDQEIQEFTPMLYAMTRWDLNIVFHDWMLSKFCLWKEGNLCDYVGRLQWVVLLLLITGSSLLCMMIVCHLRERELPAPPFLAVASAVLWPVKSTGLIEATG